jgi:nickel superoxide dismutase
MSRPIVNSLASRILRTVDRVSAPQVAQAHCDIPCGIYDPHLMQIAALSVIRMNQLIDALELPADGANKADQARYHNSLSRYVLVKEEHAELVKRETRLIWGDYFKPEQVEKYPELHTTVWNIMKLAGKNRQEVNMDAAQELLAATHRFAEIFWDTKGAKSSKQPSRQAVGGELVLPA